MRFSPVVGTVQLLRCWSSRCLSEQSEIYWKFFLGHPVSCIWEAVNFGVVRVVFCFASTTSTDRNFHGPVVDSDTPQSTGGHLATITSEIAQCLRPFFHNESERSFEMINTHYCQLQSLSVLYNRHISVKQFLQWPQTFSTVCMQS